MAQPLKLIWTQAALRQLAEAREYIAIENPRAASRLIAQIEASVNRLRAFPFIGRVSVRTNTRELVVSGTPYVVIYFPHDETVFILALWHGAMDWKSPEPD